MTGPGIMLAGAARSFLNRYGVLPGARVAILIAQDEAYRAALDLQAAGVNIVALADLRQTVDGALPQLPRAAGLAIRTGTTAVGTRGDQRVAALGLANVDASGHVDRRTEWISCDAVVDVWRLYAQPCTCFHSRADKLRWDPQAQVFVPGRTSRSAPAPAPSGRARRSVSAQLRRMAPDA